MFVGRNPATGKPSNSTGKYCYRRVKANKNNQT